MTVQINHRRRSLHHRAPSNAQRVARFDLTGIFGPPSETVDPFQPVQDHPHNAPVKPTKPLPTKVTPTPVQPNKSTALPVVTSSVSVATVPTTTMTATSASSSTSSTTTSPSSSSIHVKTGPYVPPQSVTSSASPSAASATAAATAKPSAVPASNLSSGVIAGAIIGVVGIAVVGWIILFFMRRLRKRNEEGTPFDASLFRRSALLLPDTPIHDDYSFNQDYRPRPPTMIERKLVNVPPASYNPQRQSYGQQSDQVQQFNPQLGSGGAASQSPASLTPGQVLAVNTPPYTLNSDELLFSPSAYGPSPFSPLPSPVPAVLYDQPVGQPSVRESLNRQSLNTARLTRQPSNGAGVAFAHSDYVDLSRSSISPFQAAQYAEIAKKLNTEVPTPLPSPLPSTPPPPGPPPLSPLPSLPPPSPFSDNQVPLTPDHKSSSSLGAVAEELPLPAPPYEEHGTPSSPAQYNDVKSPFTDEAAEHGSVEQETATATSEDRLEPPSPAFLRARVDSTPPILPEINLHQQTFSATPFSATFERTMTPPLIIGRSYHSTTAAKQGPAGMPVAITSESGRVARKRDTTYTLCDPDDAYGGI